NPMLHQGDNGRVFGYDNAHDYHHKHFFGNISPASLNKDFKILPKYDLIRISKESNPGHGVHKIIESSLGNQKIDFRVQI
ncbi:MAG: hypothetical protein QM479_08375, partial [Pseudomonadota bacterium]